MGQQNKKQFIVFFILLLYFSMILSVVSAADDTTLTISMLQGEQQIRFEKPVLVAGVWHYVNITTDQNIDEISLRIYKGILLPTGQKNETNYYEWGYDKNTASVWSDVSGYVIAYIQPELCQNTNTLCSFCIGIKDFMPNIVDYYENWTVEVSNEGTTIR